MNVNGNNTFIANSATIDGGGVSATSNSTANINENTSLIAQIGA